MRDPANKADAAMLDDLNISAAKPKAAEIVTALDKTSKAVKQIQQDAADARAEKTARLKAARNRRRPESTE